MEDTVDSGRELVALSEIIEEKNEIIDPNESSDREFKLCSVSQDGIFLDEIMFGADFTQKYKIIRAGDLVYNPHRINIGSV
ncbi:hypothetical protein H6768_02330 [Candidatus Peribacteria bacterium]|nr:hypothetical protein [Candidatus Peribacteria bacterium]